MVASKLKNYWSKADKYGCKVSEWAEETIKSGQAKCKYCLNSEIDYQSGYVKLIRHSETLKHRNSIPNKSSSSSVEQISIEKAFNIDKSKDIKNRTEEIELFLIRWASRHNIPFSSLQCLAEGLGSRTDDESLKSLTVGRSKCSYVAVHGIGEFIFKI